MTLLIAAIRELHRNRVVSKWSKFKCIEKKYLDLVNSNSTKSKGVDVLVVSSPTTDGQLYV